MARCFGIDQTFLEMIRFRHFRKLPKTGKHEWTRPDTSSGGNRIATTNCPVRLRRNRDLTTDYADNTDVHKEMVPTKHDVVAAPLIRVHWC